MSRTMVLIDEADPTRIVGYHTLAIRHVRQEDIPRDRPRIKRPIPAILLGQLGVDKVFQGRRFGELLLMDAQARTDEVSRRTGIRAMLLDARTNTSRDGTRNMTLSGFPANSACSKASPRSASLA